MPRVKLFDQESVLKKAMNLFWEKGYHATSMQDLVHHLRISRGSLYDTYGGKQQLFDKSITHYSDEHLNYLIDFFGAEHDVKTGIRKLLEDTVENAVADQDYKGCFISNTCAELTSDNKALIAHLGQHKCEVQEVIRDYLSKGNLAMDKDLTAISSLVMTVMTGISVSAKVRPDEKVLRSTIDAVMKLLD